MKSKKNGGFLADVMEISERADDSFNIFYLVILKVNEKPKLRFDRRVRIKEIR